MGHSEWPVVGFKIGSWVQIPVQRMILGQSRVTVMGYYLQGYCEEKSGMGERNVADSLEEGQDENVIQKLNKPLELSSPLAKLCLLYPISG